MILHGVTEGFKPISFLLYMGRVADKSAPEQAQRIIFVCKKYGLDYQELLWVISSDNTANAYNVATELKLQGLCFRGSLETHLW